MIADTPFSGRLGRLLHFYDACLERESLRELRFGSQWIGKVFVPLGIAPGALLAGEAQDLGPEGAACSPIVDFIRERKVGSGARRLYLGYPVVWLPSDERDPRELVPLMYARLDVGARGSSYRLSLEEPMQVNYLLLERAGVSLEEAVAIGAEIEAVGAEATVGSWEATISEQVARVASEARLAVTEHVAPVEPLPTPLAEIPDGTVADLAILFQADRVGYTVSVRTELEHLAGAPQQAAGTPVELLLGGSPPTDSQTPPLDLVAVTPLSEAQRAAVAAAFSRRLTVVTGPPGTGKSQLVLNVIANALVRGETLLFASRNNKAVDVAVCERFAGLTDEAALLRTGRTSYRDAAIALMRRVVSGVRPPTAAELEHSRAQLDEVRRRRASLESSAARRLEADRFVALAAARYEARLGGARPAAKELAGDVRQPEADRGTELQELAKNIDVLAGTQERLRLYASGNRSLGEKLRGLVQPDYPLSRERAQVRVLATDNPTLFPSPIPDDALWDLLVQVVETAREALVIVQARQEWRAAAAALDALRSKDSLERNLAELEQDEARVGSEFVRLARQAAVGNLPEADRRGLEQYLRVVEQLAGHELVGAHMFAKLKDLEQALFPQIQRAFPIWAITSLTARRNLPLQSGLFDLVVIDEASQCDVPSALALLLRGKRAMVIGDDKQLVHITPLDRETEQALANEAELTAEELVDFSYKEVSLFTRARQVAASGSDFLLLDEHYRSDPDIITFSNRRFYGGKLRIYTECDHLAMPTTSTERAVQWVDVEGETVRPVTGSAANEPEARAVTTQVRALMTSAAGRELTVGVVTPFRLQKELIARLLSQTLTAEEIERHQVVVDTAHGFQGDERDVMFFSPVISHGAQPGSVEFVNTNEHLFNVAVTRARSRLVVVGDRHVCETLGGLLADLAHYVTEINTRSAADWLDANGSFDTDEERRLYETFLLAGIPALPHHVVRGMEIDLTVEQNGSRLAIEVDGSSHDSRDGTRYLSDVRRDLKLSRAGWRVLRVPAWQVRLEPDRCLSEVREILGGR